MLSRAEHGKPVSLAKALDMAARLGESPRQFLKLAIQAQIDACGAGYHAELRVASGAVPNALRAMQRQEQAARRERRTREAKHRRLAKAALEVVAQDISADDRVRLESFLEAALAEPESARQSKKTA